MVAGLDSVVVVVRLEWDSKSINHFGFCPIERHRTLVFLARARAEWNWKERAKKQPSFFVVVFVVVFLSLLIEWLMQAAKLRDSEEATWKL